jgi:hypothetical protein
MASSTDSNEETFDAIESRRRNALELNEVGGVEYISLPTNVFAPFKKTDSNAYDYCRICQGNGCAQCTWGEATTGSSSELDTFSSNESPEEPRAPEILKKSKNLTTSPTFKKPPQGHSSKSRRKAKRIAREEGEGDDALDLKKRRAHHEEGKNYLVVKGPSDSYWADELNDDTDDENENFYPVIDPVTAEIDQLVVNMKENGNCFACSYDDLTRKGEAFPPMFKDKWESFVRCVLEGFRNVHSMKILGPQLHQAFMRDVIAREPVYGEDGEIEMVWSEHGIIEHFREHNIDPELQIFFLSQNVLEQIRTLNRSSMYVQHKVSGRKKIRSEAVELQGKLLSQLALLWKAKPSELFGANPDRKITSVPNPMLNPRRKVISEGVNLFKRK